MVADALIYHPTVAHYLKFVATTGMLPISLHHTIHPSHPISFQTSPHHSPRHPSPTYLPQLTPATRSRSRQSPPHAAILLPLPRLVPIPHEPAAIDHHALRSHEEAIRRDAQADARGQVRRAFPRCGCGERCEEHGSCVEGHGDWETVGICVLYAL